MSTLRIGFIAAGLGLLLSCSSSNNAGDTETYLNIPAYFKNQSDSLSKRQAQVTKRLETNGHNETGTREPESWTDELEVFASVDLNKSSFIGKYSIQQIENVTGKQTTYLALDSGLLIRRVSFLENQGRIAWIEAEKNEKSLILDSSLKWRYVADSGYSVSGNRSILGFSDMDFSVSAIFAN